MNKALFICSVYMLLQERVHLRPKPTMFVKDFDIYMRGHDIEQVCAKEVTLKIFKIVNDHSSDIFQVFQIGLNSILLNG